MNVPASVVTLCDGRGVTLRSPSPDDAIATLAFVRELSRDSYRDLNHPPAFFDRITADEQVAFLARLGAHPRAFMLCAWDGDVVVGTADVSSDAATFASHVGWIGLGVLSTHRRLGLGRSLMERLIAVAADNGLTNLVLRVRASNVAAIGLYERLGFRLVGTLRAIARLPDGTADEQVYQRVAGTQ